MAADGGWMPQSAEHLAAIDALGISRRLLAVTRADLADPSRALAQAQAMIRGSSLPDRGLIHALAAARQGALLRLGDRIVLAPGADMRAAEILAGPCQPFTVAAARAVLDSTRRTVIPQLAHLDRSGVTRRLSDDRRELTG